MDRIEVGVIVSRTLAGLIAGLTLMGLIYMAPTLTSSKSGLVILATHVLASVVTIFLLWTKAGSFGKLPVDRSPESEDHRPLDRWVVATAAIRVASAYFVAQCVVNIAYSRWANMTDTNGFKQMFLRDQPGGWGIVCLLAIGLVAFGSAPRLARSL